MRRRQLLQNLLRVDHQDRAVTDVKNFPAAAPVILPRVERRLEKGRDVVRTRPPAGLNVILVYAAPIVIGKIKGHVAKLAHLRRSRADLAFFIDDRL